MTLTRGEALQILGLSQDADAAAVEKAYRRLARRYPPELQPEKFRHIDAAYRFLISPAHRLETALHGYKTHEPKIDPEIFRSVPPLSETTLEKAAQQLRTLFLLDILYPPSKDSRDSP